MKEPSKEISSEEFIELLIGREQDVQAEVKTLKKRFRVLAWAIVLLPVLGWHWIQCFAQPSYLVPSEDDTTTLYLHKRHWFVSETVEKIEARHTDYGTVEWMKKEPNGKWSHAFEWREE